MAFLWMTAGPNSDLSECPLVRSLRTVRMLDRADVFAFRYVRLLEYLPLGMFACDNAVVSECLIVPQSADQRQPPVRLRQTVRPAAAA